MHLSTRERGNVLFILLITLAVLGALTAAIARSTSQQSNVLPAQVQEGQVNGLLSYVGTLASAVSQMTVTGANPGTLYTDLDLTLPGGGGFDDPPSGRKLYHPLGGGVTPLDSSGEGATAVATNYGVNKASIITGVGATDVTIGDIVFTAHISTAEACGRINKKITGSTDVPEMATATLTDLLDGDTVTVNGTNCADCVNQARLCVSNEDDDAWGFYAVLYPG